jgi:hypothetical protein
MRGSVELFSFVKATKIQIALDTDPKSDPAALGLDQKRTPPLNDTTVTGVSPCPGTGAASLSRTGCNSTSQFLHLLISFRCPNCQQEALC